MSAVEFIYGTVGSHRFDDSEMFQTVIAITEQ